MNKEKQLFVAFVLWWVAFIISLLWFGTIAPSTIITVVEIYVFVMAWLSSGVWLLDQIAKVMDAGIRAYSTKEREGGPNKRRG